MNYESLLFSALALFLCFACENGGEDQPHFLLKLDGGTTTWYAATNQAVANRFRVQLNYRPEGAVLPDDFLPHTNSETSKVPNREKMLPIAVKVTPRNGGKVSRVMIETADKDLDIQDELILFTDNEGYVEFLWVAGPETGFQYVDLQVVQEVSTTTAGKQYVAVSKLANYDLGYPTVIEEALRKEDRVSYKADVSIPGIVEVDGKTVRVSVIGDSESGYKETWTVSNTWIPGIGNLCFDNNPSNCNATGPLYGRTQAIRLTYQSSDWNLPSEDEYRALAQYLEDRFGDTPFSTNSYSGYCSFHMPPFSIQKWMGGYFGYETVPDPQNQGQFRGSRDSDDGPFQIRLWLRPADANNDPVDQALVITQGQGCSILSNRSDNESYSIRGILK